MAILSGLGGGVETGANMPALGGVPMVLPSITGVVLGGGVELEVPLKKLNTGVLSVALGVVPAVATTLLLLSPEEPRPKGEEMGR